MTTAAEPRRRKDHGVGAWLRTLREQAGLSQVEVARRMGYERSWVCHLERGSYDPRLSTVMRYCDAIGARIHIGLDENRTET